MQHTSPDQPGVIRSRHTLDQADQRYTSPRSNIAISQSSISQTPQGLRELNQTDYTKDSTIVKLITSNAPGAVTQVNPSNAIYSSSSSQYRSQYVPVSQHTPLRKEQMIVRRSESPIRYVTESISPLVQLYSTPQQTQNQHKQQQQQKAPVHFHQHIIEIEKPTYIEKIVEVEREGSNEENAYLRYRIQMQQHITEGGKKESGIELATHNYWLAKDYRGIIAISCRVLEDTNRRLMSEIEVNRSQFKPESAHISENLNRTPLAQHDGMRMKNNNYFETFKDNDFTSNEQLSATCQVLTVQVRTEYESHIKELLDQTKELSELLQKSANENVQLQQHIAKIQERGAAKQQGQDNSYVNKIHILSNEIDRLTRAMKLSREQQDNEINRLQSLLSSRNYDMEQHQQQQTLVNIVKFQEYEQRISLLNNEVDKTNRTAESRTNDFESQLAGRDAQIKEFIWKLSDLEGKFGQVEKINEQLRRNVEQLSLSNRSGEFEQLQNENRVLEERLMLTINEKEQSLRKASLFEKDLHSLRVRFSEAEAAISRPQKQYEEKITEMLSQVTELNNLLVDKDAQLMQAKQELHANHQQLIQLDNEISNHQKQLSDADNKITVIRTHETRVINSEFEDKLQECELLNTSLRQKLEELSKDISNKTQQICELQSHLRSSDDRLISANSTIASMQSRAQTLELDINNALIRGAELETASRTIADHESKLRKLSDTNEYLNSMIISQNGESQKLRCQITEIEMKSKQSDNLHNNRLLENEGLKKRINILENQLSNSRGIEGRLSELESVNAQLRGQMEILTNQLHSASRARQSQEESMSYSKQEIEALNRKISQSENESQTLRQRNIQLEEQLKSISSHEINLHRLSQQVEKLTAMLRDKDNEINRLRSELNSVSLSSNQVSSLKEELHRVNHLLTSRSRDVDELRRRLNDQENIINSQRIYETKLIECEKNNTDLRFKIEQLLNQLNEQSANRLQIDHSLREKAILEEKLSKHTAQLELYVKRIQHYENDISQLRQRNAELENISRASQSHEAKIFSLNEQNNRLNNDLNQMRLQISQFHQQGVAHKEEEVVKLNNIIGQNIRENEELKMKISELSLTIQQLSSNDVTLENQLAQLRRKNDELLQQIYELNNEISKRSSMLSQSQQLAREKTVLENQISQLNLQIEMLVKNNLTLEGEIQSIHGKLSEQQNTFAYEKTRLTEQISSLSRENESLNHSERTIIELKQRIEQLSIQINSLVNERNDKSLQINELEARINQLSHVERNVTSLSSQKEELTLKVRQYEEEISKLTNLVFMVQRSVEEWYSTHEKVNQFSVFIDNIKNALQMVSTSKTTSLHNS